jgi:arsenate reductase-like glutaredoxin family protein
MAIEIVKKVILIRGAEVEKYDIRTALNMSHDRMRNSIKKWCEGSNIDYKQVVQTGKNSISFTILKRWLEDTGQSEGIILTYDENVIKENQTIQQLQKQLAEKDKLLRLKEATS